MIRAVAVALIIAILAACGTTGTGPSPSPTASAVVAASPTPTATPAPTRAPRSPTPPGRYVNPVLGYAVTLPPPWRVSDCISRIETTRQPVLLGVDGLTWRSPAEEQDLGTGGTGFTGAYAWIVLISVEISSQSASDYAAARSGGLGGRLESAAIGGQPAMRVADPSGNPLAYYVANTGRMYNITLTLNTEPRPPQASNEAFEALVRSLTFVTPTARPMPTATPLITTALETVADAVAAAFAASDAGQLHDLLRPTCWFNAGYNGSEGTAVGRDKFTVSLGTAFNQGLKVTVEPRPIKPDPPMPGSFWIWSTWSEYGTAPQVSPRSNVQLVFDQIDGRWYWVGALFNAVR